MSALLASAVTGLALLAAGTVLCTGGSWRMSVRVLLDLLVAAGLLRLATGRSWPALATAAAIVVLRQLLWAALTATGPVSPTGDPPSTTADRPGRVGRSPAAAGGRATA
ncbi:hypothetical protein ACFY3U_17975 [Micromonospora sp. NPDC000089]|uniref:hypothetical protein n=1 Tax=unclassified Micromonospora TaxID=2617518 RepID=UPI00369A3AE4